MGWYDRVQVQAPRAVDYGDVAKVGLLSAQQLSEGLKGAADLVGANRILGAQQADKNIGMLKMLSDQERAQQASLLAEKNYQENVAARIAQNALSAGTLENQMLATANQKAHNDAILQMQKNEIAKKDKEAADAVLAMSMPDSTKTADKTVDVKTGKKIFDPSASTDYNEKYKALLPNQKEASMLNLGSQLEGKTKEEQDAILTPMYLKSKEAELAGVNKTKMEQAKEILDYKLTNPTVAVPFLGAKIAQSAKEWNRPEAEKLLESKKDESIKPQSYDQFKSTILGDVEKAKGKAKTLETKLLSKNTKDEVKTQTVAGVDVPIPMAEYAKSLSVSNLAPQAQMTALKMHKDKIDKFEDRMAKVNEKALEHTYKKLDAQEKAMYDIMVAREKAVIEATTDPVMRALKIKDLQTKIEKTEYDTAKIKKEGDTWFSSSVESYK